MKKILLCGAAMLFLSGCAGGFPGNPQGYAGLNALEMEYQIPEGESGMKSFWGRFGKDGENVAISITRPDGTVATYSAERLSGLTQVQARAAVEQAISEDIKEAFPGVVDSLVKALVPGVP